MSEYKVTLWPSGEVLDFNGDETLLAQLKASGKKIKSTCGGCATCSDCVIVVKAGEENLTPQSFEETRLLGNVFHITKERLSCQTKITGNVTLDITAHDKSTSTNKEAPKPQTKVRKKEEVDTIMKERQDKIPQGKSGEAWFKHWEKPEDEGVKAKKLGGNKRPKSFKFSDEDSSEDPKEEK